MILVVLAYKSGDSSISQKLDCAQLDIVSLVQYPRLPSRQSMWSPMGIDVIMNHRLPRPGSDYKAHNGNS
jgi:hypothetical protein